MSELPEIEARKDQVKGCLGGTIERVEVRHDHVLEGVNREELQNRLANGHLVDVQQVGKNLLFLTDRGTSLLLTMEEDATAVCLPSPAVEHPARAEVILTFQDGHALDFVIPNPKDKLYFFPTQDVREIPPLQELGPEPQEVDWMEFRKRLQDYPEIPVWEALTIQRYLSGIGPGYADEILFHAHIRPGRKVCSLLRSEWESLYDAMQTVMKAAREVKGDRQKLDERGFLIERRGTDRGCPSCQGPLAVIHFGKHSSYYCPHCQDGEEKKNAHEGFW